MNWEIKIDIYICLCIKQTKSEIAQSCLTLCNPMDCNLPGSSLHGMFQARVLKWVAISFSRDLPNPGVEPRSPALQADALPSEPSHHSSKASILWCSAFFIVQLSHTCITTGKTIALTRWTFVGNVMSLLFNMLSRLVITFLPRSKRLFISWLQSPSAEILEPPKIKSVTISIVSSSICHEVVVLEKTLESPLDCKEIQPVHLKDQSWVFIGQTDAEAETPILWTPHVKS